jgi:hypothetical protein
MLKFKPFIRAFTKQHHPSRMKVGYVRHPRYREWAWRVYCRDGRTFIYPLDLLDECYQAARRRQELKDANQ